jgi:hypothetical protein
MSTSGTGLSLFDGLQASGMTPGELWLQYYAVGGNSAELEVEACALGLLTPDAYEHDLIAQALNEHFISRGQDHPVRYQDDSSAV